MRYRKLGSADLEDSEISLGSWLTYAGGIEAEQVHANAAASGITLSDDDMLKAIGQALGDAPVTGTAPAPFARTGVRHRR